MKTRRVRSNSGTTLIELLVALAITVTVIAGAYEIFVNLHNWWISQGIRSEMGQNARAALNVLTQDIEEAGSKTSGYGDTQKTNLGITTASPDVIELDEYKYYPVKTPSGSTPGYQHTMVYYHVATDANTGRTNLYRQLRTTPGIPQPDQLVAENISNISFRYYDVNNSQLTGIVPYTNTGLAPDPKLGQIRRIWVSVTAGASRSDPARNNNFDQPITLSASVISKNLYSQEVLGSPTPPAVPTGLNVVDTRSCTRKLWVKWTANTDQDLAGYTLYYGINGSLQVPVQSLPDPTHPQVYLNAADVLITKSNAGSPNTYSVTIDAYTSNGLHSAQSAPVSGNPFTNITSFGAGNDTTVNPRKPSPPTSLAVAPVGNNALVLTWHAPADGSATVGYRLFRNTSSFKLNANINSKQIADENTLGPNTTTFTDTGADIVIPDAPSQLIGCKTYYYALCSVNCDDSLVPYYLYKTTGSDFAVGSGVPANNTPTSPPDIHTGTKPGWQRIFITLTNPYRSSTFGGVTAYPDFDHTCVYFSKTGYPVLQSNGTVIGGTLIPESDCGIPGWFKNDGTQQILFDHESSSSPPPPSLTNNLTYYLLAVSYDKCGNASADQDVSQTLTALCGDDPDFPGAPPPYNTYTLSNYGPKYYPGDSYSADVAAILPNGAKGAITICGSNVMLNWNYPWANGDASHPVIIDFAGFHIYRGSTIGSTSYDLTNGIPQWDTTRTDTGLQNGSTYWYTIKTADCAYENTPPGNPNYTLFRTYDISDGVNIGPVTPGQIILYPGNQLNPLDPKNFVTTIADNLNPLDPSTFTYHNNVTFYIQNTSAGSLTIRGVTASWGNTNAVLDKITIGPGPLTSLVTKTTGDVSSGTYVPVNIDVMDAATGPTAPSALIPVTLRFVNQDGSVNGYTDMRGDSIELDLDVQNDNSNINACAPMIINFNVPAGPSAGILFQSSPGLHGSNSYQVTGPSGTASDVDMQTVGGPGSAMTISGAIFDNSGALFATGINQGFNYIKMYYTFAPPTPVGHTPQIPPGPYSVIPLNNIGGNYYSCVTPDLPINQVMWYFLVAQDKTGNFDRSPQANNGSNAFYLLAPYDPCDPHAIPPAPVLSGSVMGGTAIQLTWTMSGNYTDGVPVPATDPLTYTVYRETMQNPTWTAIASGLSFAGPPYTYTDNSIASTINFYDYVYKVVAFNHCSTGAHISADSNYYRECQGSLANDCAGFFSVSDTTNPSLPGGYSIVGDTETVSLSSVCTDVGNGVRDTQYFRVKTGSSNSMDIPVLEQWPSDSGNFVGTFTTSLTAATNPIASPPVLKIAANSVVTVSVLPSYGSVTEDCPTTLQFGCDDGTPNAPSNFTAATISGQNTQLKLTWSVPTLNTNGSSIINLAGYEIDYSTSSSFSSFTAVNVNNPATTTYTLTGLVHKTKYYLRLRAYDSCATINYSAYTASTPTSITTPN